MEGKVRQKCSGTKFTAESVDSSRFIVMSGRGAFPTRVVKAARLELLQTVKVCREACWSVGKGECWDE